MVKAKRTTDASKNAQKAKERMRKKDSDLFKATLKKKSGGDN